MMVSKTYLCTLDCKNVSEQRLAGSIAGLPIFRPMRKGTNGLRILKYTSYDMHGSRREKTVLYNDCEGSNIPEQRS